MPVAGPVEILGGAEPPVIDAAPGAGYGIRIALSEVKGISEAEVGRVLAARPYHSLTDFWHRAGVSRPVTERLVLAGGFDGVYGIGAPAPVARRSRVTRRDLLLQVAELDHHDRAVRRAARGAGGRRRTVSGGTGSGRTGSGRPTVPAAEERAREAAARNSADPTERAGAASLERHPLATGGVWARAAAQSRATRPADPVDSVQLALELDDGPREGEASGLPELDAEERMRAELEILGLDVSRHVVDSYAGFLGALGATRSRDLLAQRSRSELLVAGVKVATQTPPIRSGRRVVFLTLDDGTGPVDATFFEDAQGPYAATVFHSWLLVVRGELRRTGRRGVSLRATGCWELPGLHALWRAEGMPAVLDHLAEVPEGFAAAGPGTGAGAAGGTGRRRAVPEEVAQRPSRRVLVHSSGFRLSPYADVRPAGEETREVARKLWHRSPGSPG